MDEPEMREAEDCRTMGEIRAGIDRIDTDLVRLFAERARYIDRAARIKAETDLPARIGSRVEEVVANVRRHALREGLPPDLVEKLWRRLIDWSIAREESHLGPDSLRRQPEE
ncbi:Salicylate biosynthesis protein PchB [Pseudogemmobacter humi]|uniref:chorismate mutase n=2 Tax=Pseudogemmobacter humi TaxID=2483812 RepID=A0A3P5WVL5_9RHOB|nr:Salicylate biosynthesis protein PchB [Pseudogemmobacter humi]